jgi:hypothetical protein
MAKRALLIGVNRYQIPGADLRGCVNDVKNMQQVLETHYGFAAKDIKTLTDLEATKAKITSGIKQLLKGAKAGDVLFLHYSGHGANVPDSDGDEADRRDEILCPTDLDWKDPLTDDWLRTTFDTLPEKVNLTIVMDCCHSGSNTRALAAPAAPIINRYLPNPWDIMAVESRRSLRGATFRARSMKPVKANGTLDVAVARMPELLFTGCRDYQTSADAFIEGNYNGALTFHFAKAIAEKKGKLTCRELHARATQLIKEANYEQTPQLEGREDNFDRPFLAPVE